MVKTLKYAKILKDVGFSRDQSEATIKILADVMDDKFATKQEIQQFQSEVKQEIQLLKHDIQQLRSDLIIKMGAMQFASVGLMVALIRLMLIPFLK